MKSAPKVSATFAPCLHRADFAGVATLTLGNPASRNALSSAMIEAMNAALADIAHEPDTRAVIIAAEGPAFSAGHDLREISAHKNDRDKGNAFYGRLMDACAQMMQAVVDLPKPVIAAVEGVATAAGCQLVAACDLAVAGRDARFALPGVNIGLFCSTPLVAVGRTISRKHAMEMALTGAFYSADEAERFGLVNRVVPAGRALERAQKFATELTARSAGTLAIGKRTFYQQVELSLRDAYALASSAMVENLLLADAGEGIGAFIEKRSPQWENK